MAEAKEEAKAIRLKAKDFAEKTEEERESIISVANEQATWLVATAREEAQRIAGDALEAKEKADVLQAAITAMRNQIKGYLDDYIIPNHTAIDELAEDFGHKEAGEKLKEVRQKIKMLVKEQQAATCDYVEVSRQTTAIHFVLDAFNGKVDSAMSKVKHDNFGKLEQEIKDAFSLVNNNGAAFRNARIERVYLNTRLEELRWAVAVNELKLQEREEQKAIREQMREEERARREMEKAIKEAEKEERMLAKALKAARAELEAAHDDKKAEYEYKLAELQSKLSEAEERGQRAISMAEQTRRGHVYVISNIGSFGENIFKIGMTRRLEPMDRVKELGDASVPFGFDVHAMIFSEDAPTLEKELHRHFQQDAVNKVNPRKEFFGVSLPLIRQKIEQLGVDDIHWTMKAEAVEYRESLAISREAEEVVA
ncbi:ATPase [Thalassolituus sp. HI0120]|nr:ATPase [Thalassolituus sp. HI0120]